MKKILFVIALSTAIVSCRKEASFVTPALTTSGSSYFLEELQTDTLHVQGGIGKYTISSADPSTATASISDNVISITGVKTGNTTMTVTSGDQSTTISISVADLYTIAKTDPSLRSEGDRNVNATTIINGERIYFFRDNGSILSDQRKIGWVDHNFSNYCLLAFDGELTVGAKTKGKLFVRENAGETQERPLVSVRVIKVEKNICWIVYQETKNSPAKMMVQKVS